MERPHSLLDHIVEAKIAAHPRIILVGKRVLWLIAAAISPTWGIAFLLKPSNEGRRSIAIVCLNVFYLTAAIGSTAILIWRLDDSVVPLRGFRSHGWWLWPYFLWSRCAEVLIAFYRDAMDRLKGRPPGSDLTGSWRVWLALNSYLELIIDYALLYTLLPATMWTDAPDRISDALWISASTITTSGSGGFAPAHWLPELLSTLEIFGGVILLVVCFALYAGGRSDAATPLRDLTWDGPSSTSDPR
jgi:voltage-gated potassium channel